MSGQDGSRCKEVVQKAKLGREGSGGEKGEARGIALVPPQRLPHTSILTLALSLSIPLARFCSGQSRCP